MKGEPTIRNGKWRLYVTGNILLLLFGSLIANNYQHFGNITLAMTEGDKRFTLAPVYDQLPMLYRPRKCNR